MLWNTVSIDCITIVLILIAQIESLLNVLEHVHAFYIHTIFSRELQHKIKGISMSVFTAEDVVNLSAGGNVALNLMYMNRFQSIDYALPTGSDIGKLREFIKRKYIEKKWYTDESSRVSRPVPSSSSSAHCAQGDPRALQKLGPIPTNIVKV